MSRCSLPYPDLGNVCVSMPQKCSKQPKRRIIVGIGSHLSHKIDLEVRATHWNKENI